MVCEESLLAFSCRCLSLTSPHNPTPCATCTGDNLHLVHVIPCLPLTTEMPPFEGSSVLGTSLPQEQMEREEAAWKETQVRGQRLS